MTSPIPICALAPEIVMLVAGCVVLLLGQGGPRSRRLMPWTVLAALAATLALVIFETPASGSLLVKDGLARFVRLTSLQIGVMLTLVNWYESRDAERGEFLAMMLFSLTGLLLVGAADNLVVLFLALELVSVPTYIMVILSRTGLRSLEAGTKYFYLGAMAAALMAYGFSFIYGVTGSADLNISVAALAFALDHPGTLEYGLAIVGLVLAVGGLLFKLAAVPLHFYVADVYQGATSPVAGLLGFVPKIAGLVAILKLMAAGGLWTLGTTAIFWLLWIVAVLSMCVGNILALRQTNIKRMLAYSGVAHGGYMLVGVLAGPLAGAKILEPGAGGFMGDGTGAALYYIFIYGIANLAAFAVLGVLRSRGRAAETLRDVAGLLRSQPALALLMVLAMFTLMGLPPTPGFWGKLGLFGSALSSAQGGAYAGPMVALVIIGVLNSALAAAYYLRVIAAVLLYESDQPASAAPREAMHIGALLCGFLLLYFALYPTSVLSQSRSASAEMAEQAIEQRERLAEIVGAEGALSALPRDVASLR